MPTRGEVLANRIPAINRSVELARSCVRQMWPWAAWVCGRSWCGCGRACAVPQADARRRPDAEAATELRRSVKIKRAKSSFSCAPSASPPHVTRAHDTTTPTTTRTSPLSTHHARVLRHETREHLEHHCESRRNTHLQLHSCAVTPVSTPPRTGTRPPHCGKRYHVPVLRPTASLPFRESHRLTQEKSTGVRRKRF